MKYRARQTKWVAFLTRFQPMRRFVEMCFEFYAFLFGGILSRSVDRQWVGLLLPLSFAALGSSAWLTCCWRGTLPCSSSTSLSVYSTSTAMRNMGSITSFPRQRGEWAAAVGTPPCLGKSCGKAPEVLAVSRRGWAWHSPDVCCSGHSFPWHDDKRKLRHNGRLLRVMSVRTLEPSHTALRVLYLIFVTCTYTVQ